MQKGILLAVLSVASIVLLYGCTNDANDAASQADATSLTDAANRLRATFDNFAYDKVEPSEIPGVIEIYAGDQIMYYAPDQDILIFGQFFASDGTPISENKLQAHRNTKAKSVDTRAAVTVGNGPLIVSIFTNPECPYCRRLVEWLASQDLSHVTQHWFFMPPAGHTAAAQQAKRALCAKEGERFNAIRAAHASAPPRSELQECAGADERLSVHAAVASEVGAFATPYLVIHGEAVAGFDPAKLTTLLNIKE